MANKFKKKSIFEKHSNGKVVSIEIKGELHTDEYKDNYIPILEYSITGSELSSLPTTKVKRRKAIEKIIKKECKKRLKKFENDLKSVAPVKEIQNIEKEFDDEMEF